MKLIARIFALSLVATGAVASMHIANAAPTTATAQSRVSAIPVPTCPPDDPNACGIVTTNSN